MGALIGFVMRGRMQATLSAAVLALLAMQAPVLGGLSSAIMGLLSILSSALIGLVTLRHGPREGALVGGLAALVAGLPALLLSGNATPIAAFLVVLWMPLWLLGAMLRSSRSLGLTLQAGLGFGLLLVLMLHLQLGDPQQHWQEMLQPLGDAFVENQVLDDGQRETFVQLLSSWMTGILAAGFYLQLLMALLLARSWQARLYNPGGFREEFRNLRGNRGLSLMALAMLLLALLVGDEAPGFVRDLGLLLGALFLIQGLAVAHGVVAKAKMNLGWLVALYVLLFVVMPHAAMLVAMMGLIDTFADFRGRMESRSSRTGDSEKYTWESAE